MSNTIPYMYNTINPMKNPNAISANKCINIAEV